MTLTVEKITEVYEQERRTQRRPVTAADLPFTFEDITPEWLTAVLCAGHAAAEVVTYRLDAADDGTSNRRRIFLEYNGAGIDAGLPSSVFCKGSHSLKSRISLGIAGGMHNEVHFYNQVRPHLAIETPHCYFAKYNAALNSMIVLENMQDGASFCTLDTEWTRPRAEGQMRLLAGLHGRFRGSAALAAASREEFPRQLFTVLAYWTMTINPPPGMTDMQPYDTALEFIRRQ